MHAWTFVVPAITVLIEAVRGNLPNAVGVGGIVLVVAGVAIVNHPRAEVPGDAPPGGATP